MPRKMEITVRMGCRVNCKYCPQKHTLSRYYKDDPKRETVMSLENYKMFIDKIPQDVNIIFSGMCEPFLNEECINMVEYAFKTGHDVDMYTTLVGMALDDYRKLQEMKIHFFVLHVADKDMNAKIPVNAEYLEKLNAVVEGHISGRFPITTISVHGDFHPQIADIMKKIPDVPVLREIYDRAGNLEDKDGVTILVDKPKMGKLACSKCHGHALDVNYLLPDGSVLVCPMDWGLDNIIGNLNTQTYEEIAEGEKKQAFRNRMQSDGTGDEDFLCRHCHEAKPLSEYKKAVFKENTKNVLRRIIKGKPKN